MISKISHVCKSKFSRVCKHKTTSCFSAVLGSIPSLPPWCFLGSQLPSSCIFIGSVFHCMKVHVSKDQILVKNKCMRYWQICRKWLHIIFRCAFGYLLTGDSENPVRVMEVRQRRCSFFISFLISSTALQKDCLKFHYQQQLQRCPFPGIPILWGYYYSPHSIYYTKTRENVNVQFLDLQVQNLVIPWIDIYI